MKKDLVEKAHELAIKQLADPKQAAKLEAEFKYYYKQAKKDLCGLTYLIPTFLLYLWE